MSLITYNTRHGIFTVLKADVVFNEALSNGRVYEEKLILDIISNLLLKNKILTILDVGAHIGTHTILYSKYLNCNIYTFEPQKVIYDILVKNITNNNLKNVQVYNTAVGHKNCDCSMSSMLYDGYNKIIDYSTEHNFNYGGIGLGENGEKITMITIDSLNLLDCDYIKIDVEGAESLVLYGAILTIRKFKPLILFESTDKFVTDEIKRSLNINEEIKSPYEILSQEGYKFKNLDNYNILAFTD